MANTTAPHLPPFLRMLAETEALEPGALSSLLSIKAAGADRWDPDGPAHAPMTTDHPEPEPEPASADSDDEWLPSPPKKRIRRKYATEARAVAAAAVVTDADTDAEEGECPTTLYLQGDEEHINPTHNILRRDVLELFVEDKAGKAHNAGYVGLRCRFCKDCPDKVRAPMSTVYPQTLEGMYRAVSVRFQKRHLPFCRYIPEEVQDALDAVSTGKARGNKARWTESAMAKGLRNSADGKGIVFEG